MKVGRLVSAQDPSLNLEQVHLAETFWARTRGLLFRPCPGPGEGMLITRCNSIHTFGMTYDLDLVFLDRDLMIVNIVRQLKPFRMRWCNGAASVLELGAGEVERLGLQEGQQLQWTT